MIASFPGRIRRTHQRRGIAAVAAVVLVVLANLIVVAMVLAGSREQDLTIRRLETVRAFYAAEGGMNMAIRELMIDEDEDGDGVIGTISDDGDPGTDPIIGAARVRVESTAVVPGQVTLESVGASGSAIRRLRSTLEE